MFDGFKPSELPAGIEKGISQYRLTEFVNPAKGFLKCIGYHSNIPFMLWFESCLRIEEGGNLGIEDLSQEFNILNGHALLLLPGPIIP